MSDQFVIGERVTHLDRLKQDGSTLPMAGTVVGVEVKYIVEWDGEQPRPISGWTPTYSYPGEDLRVTEVAPHA